MLYLHILAYIYHKSDPNVGKYMIHGWYRVVAAHIVSKKGKKQFHAIKPRPQILIRRFWREQQTVQGTKTTYIHCPETIPNKMQLWSTPIASMGLVYSPTYMYHKKPTIHHSSRHKYTRHYDIKREMLAPLLNMLPKDHSDLAEDSRHNLTGLLFSKSPFLLLLLLLVLLLLMMLLLVVCDCCRCCW